ncbi:MAG: monovalent cation/H(+) antiporter subunit G [Bryobacterales bacterium]|nr:monovalent cation/H(+) antiporter subunit G [Bryobacterales bacterium]
MMGWLMGFLALLGATLVLLAAIGIVRMPDLFTRMQAATKASTLGLGCVLGAAAIALDDSAAFVRAVSIGAFVMLTSPVSSHVIARAAYLTKVPLWKGTVTDEWSSDRDLPPEHSQT